MKSELPNIQDCIDIFCESRKLAFGIIYNVEKYSHGTANTYIFKSISSDVNKKYPRTAYLFTPVDECINDVFERTGVVPRPQFFTIRWLRKFYKNYSEPDTKDLYTHPGRRWTNQLPIIKNILINGSWMIYKRFMDDI